MRKTLLCFLFASQAVLSIAQEKSQFGPDNQPYFVLDTFEVDLIHLVISHEKIESVDVIKGIEAVSIYGDKAKNGAVIMKSKPGVRLFRITDICRKHNIADADKSLRICINKTVMRKPELILIEEQEILSVEITTDRIWIDPQEVNSNEKFINITTRKTDKN